MTGCSPYNSSKADHCIIFSAFGHFRCDQRDLKCTWNPCKVNIFIFYIMAQQAISENKSFRSLLLTDPRTAPHLTEKELDEIMNPAHYIGFSTYFVDAVVGNK